MVIPQPTIFISYARTDCDFALHLAKDLRSNGMSIWLDQLDIKAGERWDDTIEEALKLCQSFLVILSPSSVESDNVKDELSFALEKQKQIIPVLYQSCQIPFRLRRIQYSDFTMNYNKGFEQLQKDLTIPKTESIPKQTSPKEYAKFATRIPKNKLITQPEPKPQEDNTKPIETKTKHVDKSQKTTPSTRTEERNSISLFKKIIWALLFSILLSSILYLYMSSELVQLPSSVVEPKTSVEIKKYNFDELNNYKIAIILKEDREDLLVIADELSHKLISHGFQGKIQIDKKDDKFYEERTFKPKSFEIRYDSDSVEEELSNKLVTILKEIYPSKNFDRQPVTNTRMKDGERVKVHTENYISIFLGP